MATTASSLLTVPSPSPPTRSGADKKANEKPASAFDVVPYDSIPPAAWDALEHYKNQDSATKVIVRFKATGNAPIMKQNFYKITASHKFQFVVSFLRKELAWKPQDALYLYINSTFSPPPDDTVGALHRCFSTEGHLIVNYSSTPAWA